jgi:hypothetical protein
LNYVVVVIVDAMEGGARMTGTQRGESNESNKDDSA